MILGKRLNLFLQILFWLLAYLLAANLNRPLMPLWKAAIVPIIPLSIQAGLVYFNIYFLIPRFFFKEKVIWYLISIAATLGLTFFLMLTLMEFGGRNVSFQVTQFNDDGEIVRLLKNPVRLKLGLVSGLCLTFLFFSTILGLAREFVRREKDRASLEKERLESEMKFLRSQINPHFLFNVMNNLYATVKLKPDQAGELISRISDMLRYVIYDCNKERVRLAQELEYLRNYIYFQEMKDPDRLEIELEAEIGEGQFPLEPMLLFPFVENAFKHSYSDEAEEIKVFIKIVSDRDKMFFECKNSLPPKQKKQEADPSHAGIGIQNVKSRLGILYLEKYNLEIIEGENEFQVNLELRN